RREQTLEPDGHLWIKYGRAARRWRRAGFVVHEFSFDWRKGIARCADALYLHVETLRLSRPGKSFVLAAHSMGGLVACVYAARQPERRDRIERAVFFGSPLRGSYAAVEAVLGTYDLIRKLALISRGDDLDDLRRMAATLPGLIDMLPDPEVFPDVR